MQLGKVVGQAVSTVKHATLQHWRLLVVQPLDAAGNAVDDPLLVLDHLGAGSGDTVLLSSDGHEARRLVGAGNSPARWFVMGVVD